MRIVDDVRWELGRDAYAAASGRLLKLCTACGVQSAQIGFFGEVGFPGVSDLDALVVGDEATLVRLAALHRQEMGRSDVYKYLFCHEPLWVLDKVANDAHRLHTMEGLKCADGGASAPVGERLSLEAQRALHVAWLVFLLGLVAEMASVIRHRESLGLRLLLLVHKNLRHSMHAFGGSENPQDNSLMGSDELRAWVKQRCRQGNKTDVGSVVWDQVVASLSVACERMDAACRDAMLDMESQAPWIITRTVVLRRGTKTMFSECGRGISLNPYAFTLVKGYLHGRLCGSEDGRFLAAARRSRVAYERAGLAYPFVEPIAIARRGWKRALTLGVNRFADTLCGVL